MKTVVALGVAVTCTFFAVVAASLLSSLVSLLTRSLPVYFHVLLLVDLGLFCWASNVHILMLSGINVNRILHYSNPQCPSTDPSGALIAPLHISYQLSLVPSHLYKISFVYSLITIAAIGVFTLVVRFMGGSEEKAEFVPLLTYVVAISLLIGLKEDFFFGRERRCFLSSLHRIAFGTFASVVPFCDVIFADILTSFSKVLGDLHLVAEDLLSHDSSHDFRYKASVLSPGVKGRRRQDTAAVDIPANTSATTNVDSVGGGANRLMEVIGIVLVCLPFLFRLRQCLAEYYQTTNNPAAQSRHLFNALKYCTAFPVIAASWLINWVRSEMTTVGAISAAGLSPTEGHSRLVKSVVANGGKVDEARVELLLNVAIGIWIFFSIINSVYSLYWDIWVDWQLGNWSRRSRSGSTAPSISRRNSQAGPSIHLSPISSSSISPLPAQSILSPTGTYTSINGDSTRLSISDLDAPLDYASSTNSTPFPFFLRKSLHFRLPIVYYLAIAFNMLLRMSWIVRVAILQSLLRKSFAAGARGGHHADEVGNLRGVLLGVDLGLKGLEILRRWVWVFFRVEREAVSGRERGIVREVNAK
ncbi:EXS family-domain-containing protein [Chytriomyces sp. MP71]|nr:EXS family-domain-containing protein [Chytriomyces sp. MP71]